MLLWLEQARAVRVWALRALSWGRVRTSTDGAGRCCPGPQLPHRAGATLALPASARTANLCATLGSREAQAPREVLPSAWLRTHRSCTTPVPGHPAGSGWRLGGLRESDSATAAALPVPSAQELHPRGKRRAARASVSRSPLTHLPGWSCSRSLAGCVLLL